MQKIKIYEVEILKYPDPLFKEVTPPKIYYVYVHADSEIEAVRGVNDTLCDEGLLFDVAYDAKYMWDYELSLN